jgi:lysophospholipase L1-like esterase
MLKNLLALGIGLLLSLVLLEGVLRIFNPFPARLKGDKIILPANQVYHYTNGQTFTINSIGFRGENPGADFTKRYKVFCVGGSTTECSKLTDGQDWPNILSAFLKKDDPNIWVNNAGLNGHSTYGHQILLDDHLQKFKPNLVVFLTGCNDLGRIELGSWDSLQLKKEQVDWKTKVFEGSEVVSTILNVRRAMMASKFSLGLYPISIDTLPRIEVSEEQMDSIVELHRPAAMAYRKRLLKLIASSKAYRIQPVLCTQPALWGPGIDPVTGIDLGTLRVQYTDVNSAAGHWRVMEYYNDQARAVAAETGVSLIDLAVEMKKSSAFFDDGIHFTPRGSREVAYIVYKGLVPIVKGH